jgi:hypothetical protein
MKVLELFIGLSFTFLILSLMATIIQEILSSVLSLRGRLMFRAIAKMLEIDNKTAQNYFLQNIRRRSKLFKRLSSRNLGITRYPSYLNKEQLIALYREIVSDEYFRQYNMEYPQDKIKAFVLQKALGRKIDLEDPLFCIDSLKDIQLSKSFRQLKIESQSWSGDPVSVNPEKLEQARKKLHHQFLEMMNRVTGWYKRKIQLILILIGFTIAFCLDADTFQIYKKLEKDPEARAQLVGMAEQISKSDFSNQILTGLDSNEQKIQLDSLQQRFLQVWNTQYNQIEGPLDLGWDSFDEWENYWSNTQKDWDKVFKISGYFITALAISLGATFWFDILKLLINIRNAGKRPANGNGSGNPREERQQEESQSTTSIIG